MLNHFKSVLETMSDADFETMWNEIKADGNEGPTASSFIASFERIPQQATMSFQLTNLDMSCFTAVLPTNYAMAA